MSDKIVIGRGLGSLVRVPGSPFWYSRVYGKGREFFQTTGSADEKIARRFHQQVLDGLALDRQGVRPFLPPAAQRAKVSELLTDLGADFTRRGKQDSWKHLQCHVKPLLERFGHWRASNLTPSDVDKFTEEMLVRYKPATVNRALEVLRSAFRLAHSRGKVAAMLHVALVPENNTREGFYTRAEVTALIAELPPYLRDYVLWAFITGWRKGECSSLRWSDVDPETKTLRLSWRKSKNKDARSMALEGELGAIIERCHADRVVERPDGTVLVSEFVFHRKGRCIGDIRVAWDRACCVTGLQGKLFHDLRRSAARNLRRSGVPETVAQMVTGHKTASIFRRYSIVDDEDIKTALLKVQGYVETLSTERSVVPLRAVPE